MSQLHASVTPGDAFMTDHQQQPQAPSSSRRSITAQSGGGGLTFGGTGGPNIRGETMTAPSSSSLSSSPLLTSPFGSGGSGSGGGHNIPSTSASPTSEWDESGASTTLLTAEQMEERDAKLRAIQHHLKHHQELPLPHDLKGHHIVAEIILGHSDF